MNKYEFTGETKSHYGITLHRIRALVTIIGVVSAGDARVSDNARRGQRTVRTARTESSTSEWQT